MLTIQPKRQPKRIRLLTLTIGVPIFVLVAVLWWATPPALYAQDDAFFDLVFSTDEIDYTTGVAWGDMDADGDLDLAIANGMLISDDIPPPYNVLSGQVFGKNERHNRVYCNDKGLLTPCWVSDENDFTVSVAWGDMEGDGDLDLAVSNGCVRPLLEIPLFPWKCAIDDGSAIRLYRNNGMDKSKEEPIFERLTFAAGSTPVTTIAWGDYDGDGRLDLAAGRSVHRVDFANDEYIVEGRSPIIYRNKTPIDDPDATPVFVPNTAFTGMADKTFRIAWVDVDADGDLDLATAGQGVERVYCNQKAQSGNSTFQPCWVSKDDDDLYSVGMSWADINGDQLPELAVGNWNIGSGAVSVVYSNITTGAGQVDLIPTWVTSGTDATISVAWGDADSDGDIDLATANGNFDSNQPIRVFCNEGGSLRPGEACWSSEQADVNTAVAFGDLDGDGDLELATGTTSTPVGQQNRIYLNNSVKLSPTFTFSGTLGGADSRAVAWGDMDGDQDLDLAFGNEGAEHIYCNDDGNFKLVSFLEGIDDASRAIAWGDMDGLLDGSYDLDLVVANGTAMDSSFASAPQPNRLYRNNGLSAECQPQFEKVLDFGGDRNTNSIAWGDIDGDGDLDLAEGNGQLNELNLPLPERNRVYRNDGLDANGKPILTDVWQPPPQQDAATFGVAWGDVDNDGDLDLAVANSSTPSRLYRNDGFIGNKLVMSNTWTTASVYDSHALAWGDVDGDGDLDLAIGNTNQSITLYYNTDGTLEEEASWQSIGALRTRSIAFGDVDGDGDLDLAVGNQEGPEQLFVNQNGALSRSAVWLSQDSALTFNGSNTSYTLGIAWGDADGDGDLDLAAANFYSEPSGIYHNRGNADSPQLEGYPFAVVGHPGQTPAANYFSSAEIVTATTDVSIPFTLYATLETTQTRIYPEYSLNGGGSWHPATPVHGEASLLYLQASPWPTGTAHTFAWNAAADIIKDDDVVFRIRTQLNQQRSPIFWPAGGSQSAPFRMQAYWYVRVVDERGLPVAGARLFANGQEITVTNRAGLVGPSSLTPQPNMTMTLVALAQQDEMISARGAHYQDRAYRLYVTTENWDAGGLVADMEGQQLLTTVVTQPLVLFNLVVSIQWAASISETEIISNAMREASRYLFDLTNGQMAFGHVEIYSNMQHWNEADIHFFASNDVHPRGIVGGIVSGQPSHAIRLGIAWDGKVGDKGEWDKVDGFRTIVHEFGHYALFLYDEHTGFTDDTSQQLAGRIDRRCTGLLFPGHASTNASAMYLQYDATELSDKDLPASWSEDCKLTEHWQVTSRDKGVHNSSQGESTWETIVRFYSDDRNPPRWQILKPSQRGGVVAGPDNLPTTIPAWPTIITRTIGDGEPLRRLKVIGEPADVINAEVSVEKVNPPVIYDAGNVNASGVITIFGASVGDTIKVSASASKMGGSVTVGESTQLTVTLTSQVHTTASEQVAPEGFFTDTLPIDVLSVTITAPLPYAYIQPLLWPGMEISDSTTIEVRLSAANFDPPTNLHSAITVIGTDPTADNAQLLQAPYDAAKQVYQGLLMTTLAEGGSQLQLIGALGGRLHYLQAAYRLYVIQANKAETIFTPDGTLSLFLNPHSLGSEDSLLTITKQGAAPGAILPGDRLVTSVYEIASSTAMTATAVPGVLTIAYNPDLFASEAASGTLGIYWWNPRASQWQALPSTNSSEFGTLSTNFDKLGAYVILAAPPP